MACEYFAALNGVLRKTAVIVLLPIWGISGAATAHAAPESLFDGETLNGWEADAKVWRVEDGAITAGSLTTLVARTEFISTTQAFHNFELRLKIRLSGTKGFVNSGVQIRSSRDPGSSQMSGYQVDYGPGTYGKLYDESRRNKVIAESPDMRAATAAVREGGWDEYRIRAEGPRIRSWINDTPALDYTESDTSIPQDGYIGIQSHGGGISLIQVKDVTIELLPPTPHVPTQERHVAVDSVVE